MTAASDAATLDCERDATMPVSRKSKKRYTLGWQMPTQCVLYTRKAHTNKHRSETNEKHDDARKVFSQAQ